MPKYFPFKINGYYLYFTSHCILKCMHVHASDEELILCKELGKIACEHF